MPLELQDKVLGVPINTSYGRFLAGAYSFVHDANRVSEHLVLYRLLELQPCSLRINSACHTGDLLGDMSCDCRWQRKESLRRLSSEGCCLFIYHLHHEGRANGLLAKLRSFTVGTTRKAGTGSPGDQMTSLDDHREYSTTLAILRDLRIKSVRVLTNNPDKLRALAEGGIEIVERIQLRCPDQSLTSYYAWKRDVLGHMV